jgi:hypothetical protein
MTELLEARDLNRHRGGRRIGVDYFGQYRTQYGAKAKTLRGMRHRLRTIAFLKRLAHTKRGNSAWWCSSNVTEASRLLARSVIETLKLDTPFVSGHGRRG